MMYPRNALALIPNRMPRTHLVGPMMNVMEREMSRLDEVIEKLVSLYHSEHRYLAHRKEAKTIQEDGWCSRQL
jgi:hypothetical protein